MGEVTAQTVQSLLGSVQKCNFLSLEQWAAREGYGAYGGGRFLG